ncbi:MAG TPA: hypothetical protein PKE12_09615 [Kiritimatiellia bacterium]|nr:hypothetical protein [Kiritimatiellia bacterium]
MAKALKIFIVLLLLLSITALALAVSLFSKRETLKGRTQKLESSVAELATLMSRGEEPFIRDLGIAVDRNRLMIYDNPENPADRMDSELAKIRTLALERYRELGVTYADLKKTTDELTDTRAQLAQTRQELSAAREEIVQLNTTISQRNAEIARQRTQIETLDREKAEQQVQIDELNNQIASLEDDIVELRAEITGLNSQIGDLEARLGEGLKSLPRGLHGRVVVVNKEWNFVVLDIGSKAGLVANAEMLVHRGDKLVGKVYVSGVTRDLAIADIRGDWQHLPIEEGDSVAVQ